MTIGTGLAIVQDAYTHLLAAKFDTATARVLLLAIGMQESGFEHRKQVGGPARSYWQMEQGGGIHGVLTHPASKAYARSYCQLHAVAPVASDVYAAFLADDTLACAFARLLLWTDAAPLPVLGDVDGAWAYYLRTWRPGAWSRGSDEQRQALRAKWGTSYAAALSA